ncbi:MAG: hypothetical protein ABSG51_09225 [Terracidiphilus sp.]|jgi:hypothetical protein
MRRFDFSPPTSIPITARWLQLRKRHLQALAGLFTQALKLCQKAGLVNLGHVAIDGTKLQEAEAELEAEARQQAEEKKAAVEARIAERRERQERTGKKIRGREPQSPDPKTAVPDAKAQRNFTRCTEPDHAQRQPEGRLRAGLKRADRRRWRGADHRGRGRDSADHRQRPVGADAGTDGAKCRSMAAGHQRG